MSFATRRLRRLERLAFKYEQLAALRRAREAREAAGHDRFDEEQAAARRAAFRRIAREFPGALRELEVLTAAELEARADRARVARDRCAAGLPPCDDLVELVLDFHLTLREALWVKRWLAARPAEGADERMRGLCRRIERLAALRTRASVAARAPAADGDVGAWLELCRRPPRGRLLDLVWEELERRHGAPRAALEAAIFPR